MTQAQKDVAQVAVDNAKTAAASAQASVATSQENAANSVTAAQDSVHAATLNVASAQAQAAYDAAKTNLDAATLVAPFDATVAETNGAVGQYVNGGPVAVGGSSLFTLMDLNNLQVTTQVNEADIGKVHVVDYNVTCSIQPTKGATLYPGMTATATIVSVEHTGVLNVPNSALSFAQAQTKKPSTGSSSTSASTSAATIFTLKNGRPTSEPVTLGITDGTNTEVVSGLQAGETILLGQSKSSNGSSSSSSGQRFGGRTVFGGFP